MSLSFLKSLTTFSVAAKLPLDGTMLISSMTSFLKLLTFTFALLPCGMAMYLLIEGRLGLPLSLIGVSAPKTNSCISSPLCSIVLMLKSLMLNVMSNPDLLSLLTIKSCAKILLNNESIKIRVMQLL